MKRTAMKTVIVQVPDKDKNLFIALVNNSPVIFSGMKLFADNSSEIEKENYLQLSLKPEFNKIHLG